jgi:ketosteroid isomerase-like protein
VKKGTNMSEQNLAIVQGAYNDFKTGDIQALLARMSEDATWQLPEIAGVALAGRRTGRDSVAEFFATVARDQDVIEFSPGEFVAQGDKVVSLGHYKWRVKETGREFESDFVHVFTIRDGKIAAFREYFDTAAAAAAYQKALSA